MKYLKLILSYIIVLTSVGCTSIEKIKSYNVDQILDELCENLLMYIVEEDYEGIKELFSERTLNEVEDFETDIEYLFNTFDGSVVSWERSTEKLSSKNISGEKRTHSQVLYIIETTEDIYYMYVSYYSIDELEPKNVGISSLRLVLEEDDVDNNFYDFIEVPGIYNPDKIS